jgi:phosphohistidine swiveling domain-containing protein
VAERGTTDVSFCISLAGEPVPAHLFPKLGGKGRSLVRLAAAGLPTPAAVVVTTDLFAALRASGPVLPSSLSAPDGLAILSQAQQALAQADWPAGLTDELAQALTTLGAGSRADLRLAVRSSATIEDDAQGLAPGLFTSRLDVAPADVPEAIRAVLASALAPAVAAYLDGRGGLARVGIAVLLHRYVAGDAAGAVAFDPGGLAPPLVEVHTGGGLGEPTRSELGDAVRTLAAAHGPVEVEWVVRGDSITFLQLRPYRARVRTAWPGAAALDDRAWRWDAAHNPLPLSPAHAGLVALVDERCHIGVRQRVVGGFLFYTPEPTAARRVSATETPEPEAAMAAPEALRTLSEIAAAMLAQPASSLEDALATFTTIYEPLYGHVQPAARAARDALASFLRTHDQDPAQQLPVLLAAVPSAASDRVRCARALAQAVTPKARAGALATYLALFGDEGPRWDVAAPTWREAPAALDRLLVDPPIDRAQSADAARATAAAAAVREAIPAEARSDWDRCLADARAAAAVAEDDDVLYARLQTYVRHALLREGARLTADGLLADADDVFWLPLEAVRGDARGDAPLAPATAARAIVDAVRADEAARANPPPIEWATREWSGRQGGGGPPRRASEGDVVRGTTGSGGARIGRVRIAGETEGESAPDRTEVLVARTLLPTQLPLLTPLAIVVETGGALDHVAAQARERGIPAVVGAAGATRLLRDGDQVLVDADAGLVIRLAG